MADLHTYIVTDIPTEVQLFEAFRRYPYKKIAITVDGRIAAGCLVTGIVYSKSKSAKNSSKWRVDLLIPSKVLYSTRALSDKMKTGIALFCSPGRSKGYFMH